MLAEHIWTWSHDDGGAKVENMGFPEHYELRKPARRIGSRPA